MQSTVRQSHTETYALGKYYKDNTKRTLQWDYLPAVARGAYPQKKLNTATYRWTCLYADPPKLFWSIWGVLVMAAHSVGQSQLPPAILMEKKPKNNLSVVPCSNVSFSNPPPSLSTFDTVFHKAGSEIILDTENKHSYIGLLSDLHMNGSTYHNPRNSSWSEMLMCLTLAEGRVGRFFSCSPQHVGSTACGCHICPNCMSPMWLKGDRWKGAWLIRVWW